MASSKQQASKQQASKQQASKQQAHGKRGKITALLWCFGFGQNFGGCHLWVGGTTTRSMREKLKGDGWERVSHVVGLRFKICGKWPKIGSFGAAWVPRMSMEGSNCIATNMDDEETLLIPV